MKSRDMSSSETGSEPYQRRVLLFAATRPIVPHPPPRLSRMSRIPFALTWKGESIMQEAVLSPLTTWQTFYTIIGSAAATLTGLMFVVITLIAGVRQRRSSESVGAFGTPTVVHFCLALLVPAILSAPWQALSHACLLLGLCGLGGVIYVVIVLRRSLRQTEHQPVLEARRGHSKFPAVTHPPL